MNDRNIAHLRYHRTIKAPVVFVGIGLHSGERVTMKLKPAIDGEGIALRRRDLATHEQLFRPHWEAVTNTTMCTTIGNQGNSQVATIEHLMSALAAFGIDNIIIELDGPEIPIMDGSALPFVDALDNVGILELERPRDVLVVSRPVRLQHGNSWAELLPDVGQRITVSIDFNAHDIGVQSFSLDMNPTSYRREIAPARTFGFAEDLMQLRARGLALGGSLMNAILLRDGRVANMEGLRFRDEFVRHKVLDVVGDLSLVGIPIIGEYRGHRPSHKLNTQLLQLLMNDPGAWRRVPYDQLEAQARQPVLANGAMTRRRDANNPTQARPERGVVRDRIRRLFNKSS